MLVGIVSNGTFSLVMLSSVEHPENLHSRSMLHTRTGASLSQQKRHASHLRSPSPEYEVSRYGVSFLQGLHRPHWDRELELVPYTPFDTLSPSSSIQLGRSAQLKAPMPRIRIMSLPHYPPSYQTTRLPGYPHLENSRFQNPASIRYQIIMLRSIKCQKQKVPER